MLGLGTEPGQQLEQGQDAALYHAMSPSSVSSSVDNTNNSKMASKGIPISR